MKGGHVDYQCVRWVSSIDEVNGTTLVTVERCGTASLSVRSVSATTVRVANVVIAEQEA